MLVKNVAFVLATTSLAVFAVHEEQQFVAITCIIAATAGYYRERTGMIRDKLIDTFSKFSRAKVGNVEVQIDQASTDIRPLYENAPEWARSLLIGFTPHHLGLLLTLSYTDRYALKNAQKISFRELRNRGLVEHNASSIRASDQVWLTETGERLVKLLTRGENAADPPDSPDDDPDAPEDEAAKALGKLGS